MSFFEVMQTYFRGEKLEAIFFILPIGFLIDGFTERRAVPYTAELDKLVVRRVESLRLEILNLRQSTLRDHMNRWKEQTDGLAMTLWRGRPNQGEKWLHWVRWCFLFSILTTSLFVVSCTTTPEVPAEDPNDTREIVILLHGLARSKSAMWLLDKRIEDAGFRVERIGYDSLDSSIEEIVEDVAQQIDACCAHGTQPVHFVGHSLGGLIIRAYLAHHQPLELGRVVLIGTPNQGTPVVDHFRNRWWIRFIGETGLSLGTGKEDFPRSLLLPDYPVGVIAGESDGRDNESVLPGRDDGLVPIESTKLEGMADFVLIQTSHSMMRYDKGVAAQTVAFLRTGRFQR